MIRTSLMLASAQTRQCNNEVVHGIMLPASKSPGILTRRYDWRGDEKQMVSECSALQHVLDKYSALFAGHNTMRSFMNQTNQRRIIHFISECSALDCSTHTASGV